MSQLPALLQSRWDSFLRKNGKNVFYVDKYGEKRLRNDAVYQVINEELEEDEQLPVIVQGDVIDRFVFNGHYKIEFIGHYHKPVNTQLAERREAAKADAEASVRDLLAQLSSTPPEPEVEPEVEEEELSEEELDAQIEARMAAMKASDKRRKR